MFGNLCYLQVCCICYSSVECLRVRFKSLSVRVKVGVRLKATTEIVLFSAVDSRQ